MWYLIYHISYIILCRAVLLKRPGAGAHHRMVADLGGHRFVGALALRHLALKNCFSGCQAEGWPKRMDRSLKKPREMVVQWWFKIETLGKWWAFVVISVGFHGIWSKSTWGNDDLSEKFWDFMGIHHALRWSFSWIRWIQKRISGDRIRIFIWLVVWNIFYFPIYWVANHPNWLIFFRGGQTTNQSCNARPPITTAKLRDH